MTEPPSHAYFRPKHGRWAGDYVFANESLRALFSGSMGFFDKLAFATMGMVCRVLGPLRIETTVDASELSRSRIRHTTRVSKWGLVLQTSEEWFELGEDGRGFGVTGSIRTLPFWWIRSPYRESRGEIDEAGRCASYEFSWAGSRLRQRSTPEDLALRFVQEVDGGRATFVLRRVE